MARPDAHPDVEGGEGGGEGAAGAGSATAGSGAADVVRPGTGVVRPGTGVVRPGTGVVRPGTGVAAPGESAAVARAAVPEAPEEPLEPIKVVLPFIPVKPVKQGFLDRLVAPKPKKTEAEIAEEEARKAAEEARKAEEKARKAEEKADAKAADDARRAEAKAAEEARKAENKAAEEARKAEEKAAEEARRADEKARKKDEDARKAAEEVRRAEARAEQKAVEEARKAEEKARRAEAKAREDSDAADEDYEDEYDDEPRARPVQLDPRGLAGAPPAPPMAPPGRPMPPAPPRPGPGRSGPPGPQAPPRPAPPGRPWVPQRPAHPAARPPYAPERPARRPPGRRPEYDERAGAPRRRPLTHWLAAGAAALLLGTGSALVGGLAAPSPDVGWVAGVNTGKDVAPLSGLDAGAKKPSAAGVAAVVNPLLVDGGLGGRVSASIVDVSTGESLYDLNGSEPVTPASTAKLLTAAAVLQARGPTYRIATRAVAGSSPGEVVLVGGGDPTLAAGATTTYLGAARLDLLAEQVRKALGGTAPTRVIMDTSLYVGPTAGPGWLEPDLHAGYIAHVTALMTDGARVNPEQVAQNASRYWEPDVAAGRIFAQALGLPPEAVTPGTAPAGARLLGQVLSPTVARLVEMMLAESDNVIAEGLARQVALAKTMPASFEGAAAATKAVLDGVGISSQGLGLVDGSGLSNLNQVSAAQLTSVLAHAASPKYPQLRAIISGLPVAGYSGTLAGRYQGPNGGSGAGVVRAKTGTLTGVNALAGIAVDVDGRLLAFSMVADATSSSTRALQALDRIAAAVASCGC